MTDTTPTSWRAAFGSAGLLIGLLLTPATAGAQTAGWQVHEGPSERHRFGRTVANGDTEGFLSGAQIPAPEAAGWSAASGWPGASTPGALQWGGPGGTPCRSQANYTYFQTTVTPRAGEGYAIEFMNVDDAAGVSVTAGTGTINIPEFIGLRERKTMDLTPFLEAGMANRVVVTLADVCGASNGIRAELRSVPAAGGSDDASPASAQASRLPISTAQSFVRGQRHLSESAGHFLVLNPDGNLVVARADGGYVWGFDTLPDIDHTRVGRVDWQADGNLVAYDPDGRYLWSALSADPDPGARLVLSPGGALQIVSPSRGILWASDGILSPRAESPRAESPRADSPNEVSSPDDAPTTDDGPSPDTAGRGFPFTAGQALALGSTYDSPSGKHRLVFQDIGNLVVSGADGRYVWGFDTTPGLDFRQVRGVRVQPDGNFVALDAGGAVIWRALSSGADPAAQLVLTAEGALQLVSPSRGVLWASDGVLALSLPVFATPPPATRCTPDAGWSQCLVLNDPTIKIQGTSRVSNSAMNAVANVYAEITARLTDRYPRNDFDGFGVFITNGESLAELNALDPIKTVHADGYPGTDGSGGGTRNTLRGGACCDGPVGSGDYVWISEQMICKTGVATRNADLAQGIVRGTPDNTYRSFDQVIHEFGHSIDQKYGLRPTRLPSLYRGNPTEPFAQSVQAYFAAPAIEQTAAQMTFLNELFSSRTRFSCEGYTP